MDENGSAYGVRGIRVFRRGVEKGTSAEPGSPDVGSERLTDGSYDVGRGLFSGGSLGHLGANSLVDLSQIGGPLWSTSPAAK